MATGILEGAGLMGSISVLTIILGKLKCYVKRNGSFTYGCGFTDKSLMGDDETEIKTINVDDTTVFYVSKKHHLYEESDDSE